MKVIKGNFSGENKATEKNQKAPVIYDEDGNYSIMLLDLIKPYLDPSQTKADLEEKVQLGIIAWNLSIPKSLGIQGMGDALKNVASEEGFDKKQISLIKKIEKDKQNKYPEHTSFIQKYEIKEDAGQQIKVFLTCIPLLDLMANNGDMDEDDAIDEFDDDEDADVDDLFDDEQYDEGIIDRSAFALTRKPSFIEWARKADNTIQPKGNIIYLVDEMVTAQEANDWLKKNFQKFMTDELSTITRNKKKWPKLSYQVFCDFFEVQFHEMIWDTEEKPVNKY